MWSFHDQQKGTCFCACVHYALYQTWGQGPGPLCLVSVLVEFVWSKNVFIKMMEMMSRDIVKVSWISFKALQTSARKVTTSLSCRRCLKARKAGYYLTWFTQRKLSVNYAVVSAWTGFAKYRFEAKFFWDTLCNWKKWNCKKYWPSSVIGRWQSVPGGVLLGLYW